MTDLLGDDFLELVETQKDRTVLSSAASMYIPLDQGSIFLWPSSMVSDFEKDPRDFKSEVKFYAKKLSSWKKSHSRASDPIEEFINLLAQPMPNESEIADYSYTTRDHMSVVLGDNRPVFSRIQNQLLEYNVLRILVPSAGRRPAVFTIVYPFTPKEPAKPVSHDYAVVDATGLTTMSPSDEEHRSIMIKELSRQLLQKSRPHDTLDDAGKQHRVYKRTAQIYSKTGNLTVDLIAQTLEGSEHSVMTKTDDHIFGHLLSWCLAEQKRRRKLGQPFTDWYVIDPIQLATQLGYTDARKQIGAIRDMMERWKDTQVRARVVDKESKGGQDDFDGDFIGFITEHAIVQFADHKSQYKQLSDGRRVLDKLAFQLKPEMQKEIERRAMGSGEGEIFVQGLATVLQANTNRTLMTDSFAIAVNHFFWNWGSRYKQGWLVELWAGFSEIFDFEFPFIDPSLPPKERKRIRDGSRMRFTRMLERFLSTFSLDPEEALSTWKSTDGGIISIDFPHFSLEIQLDRRAGRNRQQTGHVKVTPLKKRLSSSSENTDNQDNKVRQLEASMGLLMKIGVSYQVAMKIAKAATLSQIEGAIQQVSATGVSGDIEQAIAHCLSLDVSTNRTNEEDLLDQEQQFSLKLLIDEGVVSSRALILAKQFTSEHIQLAIRLLHLSIESGSSEIASPGGWLNTIIQSKETNSLIQEVDALTSAYETRSSRRKISEALLSDDTSWADPVISESISSDDVLEGEVLSSDNQTDNYDGRSAIDSLKKSFE